MNDDISPRTRALLAQSLPLFEAHRDQLHEALSLRLKRSAHDPELSDHPEIITDALLRFLIEQARSVAAGGEPNAIDRYRLEQHRLGIAGRHYSRFADSLVPILRDLLGPTYPRTIATAWSDAYWSFVRRLREDESENSDKESFLFAELVA